MITMMIAGTVLMALPVSACVSMGPDYSAEAVNSLKPGMSKAELIALLGRPTSTATLADGSQQLMWVHSRGRLGRASARSAMLNFYAADAYTGIASQAETEIR